MFDFLNDVVKVLGVVSDTAHMLTKPSHSNRYRKLWYEPVAYWTRKVVNPTIACYTGNDPDLNTAYRGYKFINPDRIILKINCSNTKKHKSITIELEFSSLIELRSEVNNAVRKDLARVFTDSECQAFMKSFNNAINRIEFISRHRLQFLQFV